MDRIELAERRYREIVPEPGRVRSPMTRRELEVWLRDDVASLVAEFAVRARFREAACWPLVALRPGAATPPRRQVEAVSAALRRHASLLLEVLPPRPTSATLRKTRRPRRAAKMVEEEVVVVGAGLDPRLRPTTHKEEPLAHTAAQVERIARPFWTDLVCTQDYMLPAGGWLPVEPRDRGDGPVADGEFVVSLNPELHPVGDFVTRCLFRRVEILAETLGRADRAVLSLGTSLGRADRRRRAEIEEDAAQMRGVIGQLYATCQPDGEFAIRDSCVTLTQVYSAFHRAPDVAWLGLDDGAVEWGRVPLRYRLTRSRSSEPTDRVAAALGDLRRLYANEPPGRSALEEAVASGSLVLTTDPPRASWRGRELKVKWGRNRQCWKLLLKLAEKGWLGASVGVWDMYKRSGASKTAMSTLVNRLKPRLPADLRKLIVPGTERQTYRLTLDPHRITVIKPTA